MNEIPVQIPDDYSQSQKLDALETAETSIELDLKRGNDLTADEVDHQSVRTAIKQKATCELIKGAPHPDDVSLGDLEDSGDTKMDFARSFCETYQDLVEDILDSDIITDVNRLDPYSYTTKKPQ